MFCLKMLSNPNDFVQTIKSRPYFKMTVRLMAWQEEESKSWQKMLFIKMLKYEKILTREGCEKYLNIGSLYRAMYEIVD